MKLKQFISGCLIVLSLSLSLCSLAAADGFYDEGFPAKLRHGVNVDYIFGNLDYNYLKDQDPFATSRLNALLTMDDMISIKGTSPNQFDHIRIPIDPRCVGANSDGTKNTNYSGQLIALKNVVDMANAKGLSVILDLHPNFINVTHLLRLKTSWGISSSVTSYDGPYKKDLATFTGTSPASTHPLRVFWTWFAAEFASKTKDEVAFEILNEPMTDWQYDDFAAEFGNNPGLFNSALADWESKWRTLQLKVADDIEGVAPGHIIILTSYRSDIRDLMGWMNYTGVQSRPDRNTNPYTVTEIASTSHLSLEALKHRLIWNFHFYLPQRYTHTNWSAFGWTDPNYWYRRDYWGVNNSYDPEAILTPFDDQFHGQLLDRDISTCIEFLGSWKKMHPNSVNHMMTTEFGAKRRLLWTNQDYGAPDSGIPPGGPPGGGGGLLNDNDSLRANWYYDVRTSYEEHGYGWTAFEWIGGFRTFNGSISVANANGPIHGRPTDRIGMIAIMQQGLFGNDRPTVEP